MTPESERTAFLRQIRERPDDDTVRLVYADWLEEHGEGERAEFIRVQIELARDEGHGHGVARPHGGSCDTCDRLARLGKRERALLTGLREQFRRELPDPKPSCHSWDFYLRRHEDGTPDEFTCSLDRGFVYAVTCPAEDWLRLGDAILAEHPVAEVRLTSRIASGMAGFEGAPGVQKKWFAARWPGIAFVLPSRQGTLDTTEDHEETDPAPG